MRVRKGNLFVSRMATSELSRKMPPWGHSITPYGIPLIGIYLNDWTYIAKCDMMCNICNMYRF